MRGRVLVLVAIFSSIALLVSLCHDWVAASIIWAVVAFGSLAYIGKHEKELLSDIDDED